MVPGPGGVCSGGKCLLGGVVSAPGGVYVCLGGGGAWSGGVGVPGPWGSAPGGVPGPGGVGIPACIEAEPPPVNRMTDRCKNITLATTSLRPVISQALMACG